MKNLFLFIAVSILCFHAKAQKFGYIDTEFIMSKVPEYSKAQQELNTLSAKWQKEIEEKFSATKKLKDEFQAEEILLTEDLRKERLDTIARRDKEAKELQRKSFGPEGLLFLKKQELVKPVQDKVYAAIEKVAKKKALQIIFDKSGDLVMLYTDPKHDYTDFVLDELGLGDKNDTIDNKRGELNKDVKEKPKKK
ncbi:MAG: OmpH family outer membrane protein [Opitutaceae bacterium]|nr:OmpH family outer membrane protein [Cytophagales bacterium]